MIRDRQKILPNPPLYKYARQNVGKYVNII